MGGALGAQGAACLGAEWHQLQTQTEISHPVSQIVSQIVNVSQPTSQIVSQSMSQSDSQPTSQSGSDYSWLNRENKQTVCQVPADPGLGSGGWVTSGGGA